MIQLRDYQSQAVEGIRQSYRSQKKAPLLVLPTGGGKTVVFTYIASNTSTRGKRVLILVHRVELLRQTSRALAKFGVDHGLINPNFTPDIRSKVQVASVQTLVRRLDRYTKAFTPDLIIVDECFPKGTLVDGKPIEKLRPGDAVQSFNHDTGQIENRQVTKLHVRNYDGPWYRIRLSNGSEVVCTENHPFYVVGKGYVKAKDLQNPFGCNGMMPIFVYDQSLEAASCREDEGQNVLGSRRERPPYKATNCPCVNNESPHGACNKTCSREGKVQITSESLQGGHSLSRSDVGNRSGWKKPQDEEVEIFGQEEVSGIVGIRLDSIEIYQRGSGSRPEWVPRDNRVYNLHVEANLNYFANGILVHNCHHATASTWRKILEAWPTALVLGVTATPIRGDGTGLGQSAGGLFDDLIVGPQVPELIAKGFLVKPIVYAPAERLDLTGVRIVRGDYDNKELAARVDKPKITGDAVDHYRRLCPGAPAVVFCVSIAHAEHVANEFRAAGYRAYAVDGSMDDDERKRVLSGLGNGSVQVVCSCDLISEGTDIPAIACAILLRPTQSMGLYIQQVGRALRTLDGKSSAFILDHVGNVLTHGMPDELREWSLDGDTKRRKKKKDAEPTMRVKQCEQCFAVHAPSPKCPHCGFVYVTDSRKLDQKAGELKQITPEQAAMLRRQQRKEVAKARSVEELEKIAAARGYKPGWVKYVMANREKKYSDGMQ
jgi:superfamily II DNA or RNA helicase